MSCGRMSATSGTRRKANRAGRPYLATSTPMLPWRLLQRFMRPAQIVERDVQPDCRQVAVNLFAKAIAQTREPL